jgi:hypothetical protein
MSRFNAARLLVLGAALTALVTPATAVRAANASRQVIFSKAVPAAVGTFGTFGYWIWCDATLTKPGAAAGDCSGSIYFYAIKAAAEHVDGNISQIAQDQYQMTVHSTDWSCTLTNTPPVTHGPTNSVVVICSRPSGSGTATGSIVNVTGP